MEDGRYPLREREFSALQKLISAVSETVESMPLLEKRARNAEDAWDDLKEMGERAETALTKILLTVPQEKLMHIRKELRNTKIYYIIQPDGLPVNKREPFCYVPTEALNVLMNTVIDSECLVCYKTDKESRKCPIKKALERVLPWELPGTKTGECKYSGLALGTETAEDDTDYTVQKKQEDTDK